MQVPQSDHAIARGVAEHGTHRLGADQPDEQCIDDMRWAAPKARRLLGARLGVQGSYDEHLPGSVVISVAPRGDG